MPLFLIRRDLPGATEEDVDAGSYRAVACAFVYTNMRWVTSYWNRAGGELWCVYEAESAEQLVDHARRARIPCDEIREVTPLDPQQYGAPLAAPPEADSGHP